ncbi:MAG: flagellar basal body-associated FliL family protein [Pseudomonadota bacterium]
MAEEENNEAGGKSGGGMKMIILIVVAVVLASGTAVGVTLALTGGGDASEDATPAAEEEVEEAPKEYVYVDLEPEFVINFKDRQERTKFLKAEMSVVTVEEDGEEEIEKHMPAIRNTLVMLLGQQVYEDLLPPEGKEKLRTDALAMVQDVLEKRTGAPVVDDLYFANFVMH